MEAELPEAGVCHTYPGDDELPAQVLHLGLHLAADVELVAVERDALQVGQQVLLARRVRALRGNRGHVWLCTPQLGQEPQGQTRQLPLEQGMGRESTALPAEGWGWRQPSSMKGI